MTILYLYQNSTHIIMAKLTPTPLVIKGESGKDYSFELYPMGTTFNPVGGVYVFTERTQKGTGHEHKFIYCGRTNDLSERFDNHHKMPEIIRNGANCLGVKSVSNDNERNEIEVDLLAAHNFICNEVMN